MEVTLIPDPFLLQITYTDDLVNILRITYYVVQLSTLYIVYMLIKQKVGRGDDHPMHTTYDPIII